MKIIFRLLLALLLTAGAVVVGLKQNAIATARAEHQALLGESEEARRLAEQNKDITRLREENEELMKLRQENKELPKLRNEVRQLRRQAAELNRLRAENKSLEAGPARIPDQGQYAGLLDDSFSRARLKNAGMMIPRATLLTYFWAKCAGDLQRFRDCLTPQAAAAFAAETDDSFRDKMNTEMAGFTGYQITDRTQDIVGEINLTVKLTATGETLQMRFILVGKDWKLAL